MGINSKNTKNTNIDANFISERADDLMLDINGAGLIDDINRSNEKKNKNKKNKEKEQIGEAGKKTSRVIFMSAAALGVAALVTLGILIIPKISATQFIINTVEPGTIVNQFVVFADDIAEEEKESGLTVVEGTISNPVNLGETAIVKHDIYTKKLNEESFKNHEGVYNITFSDMLVGYDNVIDVVDEYNKTAESKLKLPSKSDYAASNTDLALINVEVSYPEDFPTYNSEGIAFIVPSLRLSVKGTCEELLSDEKDLEESVDSYIVVDEIIYNIAQVIKLTNDIKEANIIEKYNYKFLTSLPSGADADSYNFELIVSFEDIEHTVVLNGDEVKVTEKVEESEVNNTETSEIENATETVEVAN